MEIKTIPHSEQRYETCGDYWVDENGVQQVRISELNDWRYEVLIAVHEIVELSLARDRSIDEDEITKFDIKFEQAKARGECFGEAAVLSCHRQLLARGDKGHRPGSRGPGYESRPCAEVGEGR